MITLSNVGFKNPQSTTSENAAPTTSFDFEVIHSPKASKNVVCKHLWTSVEENVSFGAESHLNFKTSNNLAYSALLDHEIKVQKTVCMFY